MRRVLLVMLVASLAFFVRWFVKVAAGAKAYSREPQPNSIDDSGFRTRGTE